MNARLPLVVLLALAPTAAAAQRTAAADALAEARGAQRIFEIERIRWLPPTARSGGRCDEIIGRMCLNHDEGSWWPSPEPARIVAARAVLLDRLAAAHERAPGDPWILGQRVHYLGEAGRWEAADSLAEVACAARPDAWCRALRGLALHALGRFEASEAAFRDALDSMEADSARAWLDPEPLLDGRGRAWLDRLAPTERARRVEELWTLADPLLLVPGRDQLTEYLARRTLAWVRADARSPYAMAWSRDLEEMLLRYGAEVGWERIDERSVDLSRPDAVVGHHPPDSRSLMPPGAVLEDPATAPASAWVPDFARPRSTYAPAYAAAILPADAQLAVFPRGDRFVVVGGIALPADTTERARTAPEERRQARPPWRGAAAEIGLFAVPRDGLPIGTRQPGTQGALMVELPAGAWVASAEVWDPASRRAGRTRVGLNLRPRPAGEPSVSDLLLVDGPVAEGSPLAEAVRGARPGTTVPAGRRVGLVWELFGFSSADDPLAYRLTVERRRPGLLERAARALRLLRPPAGRLLEWQEQSPSDPAPSLRSVELDLAELDPGSWAIRLEIRPRGRSPLVVEREIVLIETPQG